MAVELTEPLLAKLAGWEAMKAARAMLAGGRVVSSSWLAPELRGVIQQGTGPIKSGLIIRSASDADNLCPCKDSRDRGLICAHAIAIGLHFLNPPAPVLLAPKTSAAIPTAKVPKRDPKKLLRAIDDSAAEPLELNLIFPPNLAEAAARGKLMVYCEAKWGRGLMPLNAVPLDQKFSLSAQDATLLEELESFNDGDTPAMLMLETPQFAGLLQKLNGHPRLSIGRSQSVEVMDDAVPLSIIARLQEKGGFKLSLKHSLKGTVLNGEKSWLFSGSTFQLIALPKPLAGLLKEPFTITRAEVPQFLNTIWPTLLANCELDADFSQEDFEFTSAIPKFKLHLSGGLAMLEGSLECYYGTSKINPDSPATGGWLEDEASPFSYKMRDFQAEKAAVDTLKRSGFIGPDSKGTLHLKGQELVLKFFARQYPALEKSWDVTLEARLEQSTQKNLERIEPQLRVAASGEEWFDLSVAYSTSDGESISSADIQSLLRSGQSHKRLANGKFALIDADALDEFQEILVDCQPHQRDGSYRIENRQAGFLTDTIAARTDWKVDAPQSWRQRVAQQTGQATLTPPDLGGLESVLRPYQKHGVAWLSFLRESGTAGILADEMGLGKTLQVLAFLQSINANRNVGQPFMVVCPTSLVTNWAAESTKFTPQLKVLVLHGTERKQSFGEIANADLVITSYALMRRDINFYRGLQFDTVILDEAQHIKNRTSQNAQSVKALRSDHRIVLTGTPVENSVLDLWSIFDFLMPGYLGNAADFKERYEVPLTKDKNPAIQARLKRRLKPFILRRLKREVAADLPEKIEQVSYCELNEEQRAVYNQVLDATRREILAKTGTEAAGPSRMLMLTALLRLRQICCDLRLLNIKPSSAENSGEPTPLQPAQSTSGKVEMFAELLEEVIDGGHRALVFSQFTSMLALLKEQLDAEQISYCYLDGSTKDRAAVVEIFQRNNNIPVFLISLKAGGTGLNLTGADTVIHFDPWWNPAVESQATDRAHRIGQKRVVTSYKIITRGTVEEKILNLQNRKKSLLQGVVGEEEVFVNSLDWKEIQELLSE